MPATHASEAIVLLGAAMRRVLQALGAPRAILAGWPEGVEAVPCAPSLLPVLRFLPPYILTEKDVDKAIKILAKLFKKV